MRQQNDSWGSEYPDRARIAQKDASFGFLLAMYVQFALCYLENFTTFVAECIYHIKQTIVDICKNSVLLGK